MTTNNTPLKYCVMRHLDIIIDNTAGVLSLEDTPVYMGLGFWTSQPDTTVPIEKSLITSPWDITLYSETHTRPSLIPMLDDLKQVHGIDWAPISLSRYFYKTVSSQELYRITLAISETTNQAANLKLLQSIKTFKDYCKAADNIFPNILHYVMPKASSDINKRIPLSSWILQETLGVNYLI